MSETTKAKQYPMPPSVDNIPQECRLTMSDLKRMAKETPHANLWMINVSETRGRQVGGVIHHTMKIGDDTVEMKVPFTRLPYNAVNSGIPLDVISSNVRFAKIMQPDLEAGTDPLIVCVTDEYAEYVLSSTYGRSESKKIRERGEVLQAELSGRAADSDTALFGDSEDRHSKHVDSADEVWKARSDHLNASKGSLSPQWDDEDSTVGDVDHAIISLVETTNKMETESKAVDWFKSRGSYTSQEKDYIIEATRWPGIKRAFERAKEQA